MESWLSVYIAAPVLGWLMAQFIKLLLAVKANKSTNKLSMLFKSGNMPSSHSATMVALLTIVGFYQGVASPLFGVVAIVTAVIMYDAVNVRRAVGEQGEVLKGLAKSAKFYTAKGHKLHEVVAGSLVGIVAAVVILYIFEIF